jgi:hypothetical protein
MSYTSPIDTQKSLDGLNTKYDSLGKEMEALKELDDYNPIQTMKVMQKSNVLSQQAELTISAFAAIHQTVMSAARKSSGG